MQILDGIEWPGHAAEHLHLGPLLGSRWHKCWMEQYCHEATGSLTFDLRRVPRMRFGSAQECDSFVAMTDTPAILIDEFAQLARLRRQPDLALLVRRSKPQRLPPSRRIPLKHRLLRQTRHSRPMPRLQALIDVISTTHRDFAKKKKSASCLITHHQPTRLQQKKFAYHPKAHLTSPSN